MFKRKVGFIYHPVFLEHVTPAGHPERVERLHSITEHLHASGVWEKVIHVDSRKATEQEILLCHAKPHFDFVKRVTASGAGMLDEGDTHAVAKSFDAALYGAGATLSGVDAVISGSVDSAFCAVRPPGHHAERDRPMGFCLFNNIAIGARYAQTKGKEKIAILDWDVHHGNGTQHIFESDPTVLFISLHQYPFYPGTGGRDERGIGAGDGYTLNIPLTSGSGEGEYLEAFEKEVVPSLTAFKPDLLMISAGFDAHREDPLGGMQLTDESYAKMTHLVRDIAPIVSVLEGGYNLEALARSVSSHLNALGN